MQARTRFHIFICVLRSKPCDYRANSMCKGLFVKNVASGILQIKRSKRETATTMEVVLYNLIRNDVSLLCHILLVIETNSGIIWKGINMGINYRRWRSLGAILDAGYKCVYTFLKCISPTIYWWSMTIIYSQHLRQCLTHNRVSVIFNNWLTDFIWLQIDIVYKEWFKNFSREDS